MELGPLGEVMFGSVRDEVARWDRVETLELEDLTQFSLVWVIIEDLQGLSEV